MFYSYINGKYEYDRIMELDYRLRLGAGIGLQWLEGRSFDGLGTWSFNQELGASWVKERYESAFTDDYAAFRYAHHLTWDPGWLDGFLFTHNFEYLPDTADWAENYIVDSDFGFTYGRATSRYCRMQQPSLLRIWRRRTSISREMYSTN